MDAAIPLEGIPYVPVNRVLVVDKGKLAPEVWPDGEGRVRLATPLAETAWF